MTKEALKLALEALKEAQTNDDGMEKWDRNKKAITAIKEALAQPEQRTWVGMEAEEVQELRYKIDVTAHWTYDDFAQAIEAKLKEKNTHDS